MLKEILEIEGNKEKFSVSFKINTNYPNLTPKQWERIQKAIGRMVGFINRIL